MKRAFLDFMWHSVVMFMVAIAMTSLVSAATIIPSVKTADGKVFRDVRWGPVNQGKVVMFHNRGVAIVPLEDLPEEYQAQFGYTPPPPKEEKKPESTFTPKPNPEPENSTVVVTPPPPPPVPSAMEMRNQLEQTRSQNNSSRNTPGAKYWKQYNDERVTQLILEGKLVAKQTLTPLTGYVVTSQFLVKDGNRSRKATVLELAVRRSGSEEVADAMSLRPALWRSTGEQVLLLDYTPDGEMEGALIRVHGKEIEQKEERRCFLVGIEPGYTEWMKLRKLQ
jgi:hypothetical protein